MAYANSTMRKYADLNTIPALLSSVFFVSSLYAFGGIAGVELPWLDYTLTAEHAMLVSLATMLVAFMSSETKQFQNYEDVEKGLIALGPIILVVHEYAILGLSWSQTMQIGAFVLTAVSWTVAVR